MDQLLYIERKNIFAKLDTGILLIGGIKNIFCMDQRDGSEGKGACQQTWRSEFVSQDAYGKRGESIHINSAVTSVCMLTHMLPL